MKRFSIILPVRNGGAYLKECVNSILQQDCEDFNLIILDNSSSDGSLEWLRSLNDSKIEIHSSSTALSIEENWSRVKHVPKNEFMTLIGHDDILLPFYLSEFSALIDKHPEASIYQSHFDYIDKDGLQTRKCLPMDEIQHAHEFLASQMNDTINSTGTGYMMRSKDYDALNGISAEYPNLIFADYHLWIRLTQKSYKATTLKKCFEYREHLSVSRITNGMIYQQAFTIYVEFLSSLKKSDPKSAEVIDRYGSKFLLSFCQSLSHRLLKTPRTHRSLTVQQLVDKFKLLAELLIPGQPFQPSKVARINYAIQFDRSDFHRAIFQIYKSITT